MCHKVLMPQAMKEIHMIPYVKGKIRVVESVSKEIKKVHIIPYRAQLNVVQSCD